MDVKQIHESQILHNSKNEMESARQAKCEDVIEERNAESFYKGRTVKTVILLIDLLIMGSAISVVGPSFVDLELYLQTDTSAMSFISPIQNVGILSASLVTMLGVNRLSTEVAVGVALCCLGVAIALWTSVPSIYWFFIFTALQGFCSCMAACESQPYCLKLWENHWFQKPVIHSIYALIALGLALGPFIVTPFLANLNPLSEQYSFVSSSDLPSFEFPNTTDSFRIEFENPGVDSSTRVGLMHEYTGNVRYAFMAAGLPLVVPSLLFLVISFKTGVTVWRKKEKKNSHEQTTNKPGDVKLSDTDRKILLGLTFLFYTFNSVTEYVPITYFTLYVTTVLGWSSPQRTLINSAFHGSLCFGRILGIPLSGYFKQRTILTVNMCVVLSGAILLLLSTQHNFIMWTSACLMGFGLSTMFGGMILWLSETITVTSGIMGAIVVSSCVGSIFGPLIAGQLFARVSPMCMTYMVLGGASCDAIIFVALRILERTRLRKASLARKRQEKDEDVREKESINNNNND